MIIIIIVMILYCDTSGSWDPWKSPQETRKETQ